MANTTNWWDSFIGSVSELGSTWLGYDLKKEQIKNSGSTGSSYTDPITTNTSNNTALYMVGGGVLLVVLLLVARK